MEKENIAWVFVRAVGVYFSAQALLNIFSLGTLYFHISTLYDISNTRIETEGYIIQAWVNLGFTGLEFLLFLFLAYYCLRKGKFVHKLLMYSK